MMSQSVYWCYDSQLKCSGEEAGCSRCKTSGSPCIYTRTSRGEAARRRQRRMNTGPEDNPKRRRDSNWSERAEGTSQVQQGRQVSSQLQAQSEESQSVTSASKVPHTSRPLVQPTALERRQSGATSTDTVSYFGPDSNTLHCKPRPSPSHRCSSSDVDADNLSGLDDQLLFSPWFPRQCQTADGCSGKFQSCSEFAANGRD